MALYVCLIYERQTLASQFMLSSCQNFLLQRKFASIETPLFFSLSFVVTTGKWAKNVAISTIINIVIIATEALLHVIVNCSMGRSLGGVRGLFHGSSRYICIPWSTMLLKHGLAHRLSN